MNKKIYRIGKKGDEASCQTEADLTKKGITPQISTKYIPQMHSRPNEVSIASNAAITPAWANSILVETQSPPLVTNDAYNAIMMMVNMKNLVSEARSSANSISSDPDTAYDMINWSDEKS